MRTLVWLLVFGGIAHADSSLSEYGNTQRLEPAEQLVEASCDVDVELRGTIADVTFRQRIVNPGPGKLAAVSEIEIPAGARVIGTRTQLDRGKSNPGVAVAQGHYVEQVSSEDVLGADPLLVEAAGPAMNGNDRYRMIVQPLDADHEISIELRWTAIAAIRSGEMRLVIPGRSDARKVAPCRGSVKATPGPGATVSRIRVAGTEARTFVLDHTDVAIDVELGFAKPEPLVWTQTESLGEGWTAQAVTVVAPPARATSSITRRALFVIDGSRSMELVGRNTVTRLVRAIGAALPNGAEIEAIVYDRTPSRVLGAWKPLDPTSMSAIESAITKHPLTNGTDPNYALALANNVIGDGTRGQAMVILITDGGFGNPHELALVKSLSGRSAEIDLHAIVLDPANLPSPGEDSLRAAVNYYGGTYVEVRTSELDEALTGLESWLRPSLLQLALRGSRAEIPDQLRAGTGITMLTVARAVGSVTLVGHGDQPFKIAARPSPAAPLAQLALAAITDDAFVIAAHTDDSTQDEHAAANLVATKLRARHPAVDGSHSFAALTTVGKVARTRRDMIAGGGTYTRMIEFRDPTFPAQVTTAPSVTLYSPIDRVTLERLFRDQLRPRAYACYQRALGKSSSLAGNARFELEIGRGEIIHASVVGLGDAAFDACLTDAAYSLEVGMPNLDISTDDRTVAHYPLTFSVRDQNPFIVLGDADSASPLDIDAIKGGVPRGPVHVDTSTPLGQLRPH